MTEINLLPWRELKREHEKKQFTTMLFGALVLAAGLVFMINYYAISLVDGQTRRNQRLQDEITIFNKQIQEIKKLKEIREALISRMNIVQNLQATRTLTVHLFDELVKVVPDGVYLTKVKRVEHRVTVLGYSESNSSVSTLMRNIELNPWINDPELTEIKKNIDSKTGDYAQTSNEFKLSFTLKSDNKIDGKS
ncbi:PilN domain-containing protein [Legionella spiritensis]|uniref:Tfp pilus assembly protein PilN n=1 Tax=Legionella spiritensis TaxID=452 RepID=A0A0W0Z6X7_LEGSP|nr:PilN domain-containing protein [Legionella spiritensis]KTD64884.1 Tfp pilus assembly protein PilN [Legionella spiritensis]SNV41113.1 type IV pilus assembly protein PilN [Legionella spiritensis]VEG90525.1 type IV pilus assembly protein PilN [Legionella spiritensis]